MMLRFFSINTPLGLRGSVHALSRTAIRFLSSKNPGSKPEDAPAAAPPKKQVLAKGKTEERTDTKSSAKTGTRSKDAGKAPKRFSKKYLAFKDLPQPSQELQDMSTEQFHARLHMREAPEKSMPTHQKNPPLPNYRYDFQLDDIHRLPSRKTGSIAKESGGLEPNLALLGISFNADTLASGFEEHPLRESITGMCSMNPLLKEIKNKSLWELFPENSDYGASPFGKNISFGAFKEWEDLKAEKNKSLEEKRQRKEREFTNFCSNLQESNSFVRSTATSASEMTKKDDVSEPKTQETGAAPVETFGRRKLDRGLLRQYRKYRKEQNLKDLKNDKENEEDK